MMVRTGKTAAQLIGDDNFFPKEVDELIGRIKGMDDSWVREQDNRLRKYLYKGNKEGRWNPEGRELPFRKRGHSPGVAVSMEPVYKDMRVRVEVFEPYDCSDNDKMYKQIFNTVHDLSKQEERERFVHNLSCLITSCRDGVVKGKCI